MSRRIIGALVAVVLAGASCGSDDGAEVSDTAAPAADTETDEQRHPDVLGASATMATGGWTIEATISSPYDSPERYADAWRVLDPAGNVLGVRELLHDHAGEQPFTRSLTGVEIPEGIEEITIEGRDLRYGWGGATITIELDRAS